MNNNSDQIRRLQNVVILEGALAELEEPRTGTGKDGINYISLRGAVQCGDTGVYTRSFRAFIKEKKTNGEDSKVYKDVVEWLKTATPMTKNAENPTMVRLQGSLSDNVYVNREGVLVEGTEVSVQFFNEFKSFNASLQLEGYIKDIKPEVRGKDDDAHETGRYKMHFITRDFLRILSFPLRLMTIFSPLVMMRVLRFPLILTGFPLRLRKLLRRSLVVSVSRQTSVLPVVIPILR